MSPVRHLLLYHMILSHFPSRSTYLLFTRVASISLDIRTAAMTEHTVADMRPRAQDTEAALGLACARQSIVRQTHQPDMVNQL